MKTIQQSIIFLSVLCLLAACGDNDPKPLTEEEQQLKRLSKNWILTVASVDGNNVDEWFDGLTVSFIESKSFTVQNAVPPIWIASGSFELEKIGSNYVISRSDGVELTITTLSETSVVLTMSYVASSGARTEGISGSFSFTFEAE